MSHTHDHTDVSGRKLVWTMIFNLAITVAEFVGGILTGYLALLADAVHNLSDVAALGLAWLGVKGSQQPATKRSTYGYKRVEVMTAFISATALVVIAIFILMEAYDRYLNPVEIVRPWIFLTVAVIGLIGNVLSIWFLHSEKGKSLNMKTAFLHMAYDAISSVVVIIGGIIIIYTGWNLVDVILSAVIALMIFWSSYLVIKEAVWIFLEAVPDSLDFDGVYNAIAENKFVSNVHDLHIWSLSSREIALSCHVCLEPDYFQNGPNVVEEINRMLHEQFDIGHCTIQTERDSCNRPHILCSPDNHNHTEQSDTN